MSITAIPTARTTARDYVKSGANIGQVTYNPFGGGDIWSVSGTKVYGPTHASVRDAIAAASAFALDPKNQIFHRGERMGPGTALVAGRDGWATMALNDTLVGPSPFGGIAQGQFTVRDDFPAISDAVDGLGAEIPISFFAVNS